MRTIRYILGLLMGSLVILNSCYDDPGTEILLTDSYIEIQEATTSGGLDVSKAYNRLNDGVAIKDSIRINLVGQQRNVPISVSFNIDPSSTAVPDVHYQMVTTGTSITIPANSNFGYIYFNVMADNIEVGEVWKLKFNLTDSDTEDVILSTNYKSFTRSIRITCPFVRNNFLGLYNCLEPGYGNYDVTFSTDADATTIVSNNFWDTGAVVKYVFNAGNNSLQITTTEFTANIGAGPETLTVLADGAATYDACERSFIVPYKVTRKSTGATIDSNTHTFTRK